MNNLDKNWNHLFGEYTTNETAWYGRWTVYSPNQEVMKSQQAIRSFSSNLDNTVITHINRYVDEDVEEKIWQIDRATCNQPDGVVHPAMPFMRALSFGAGATAGIVPRLVPGKPFGVELFFRDCNWRTSVAIVYEENGYIDQIVHIREHLDSFSNESPCSYSSDIAAKWSGKKCTMTADLSISAEVETQLSFDRLSGHHPLVLLPAGLILSLPERVNVDRSIQIAAAQQTANHELKYFAAHYNATGTFTSLIAASLQQDI